MEKRADKNPPAVSIAFQQSPECYWLTAKCLVCVQHSSVRQWGMRAAGGPQRDCFANQYFYGNITASSGINLTGQTTF